MAIVHKAYELPKKPMVPREALTAPRDWRKARTGMSDAHLALIRKLPCSVCHIGPGVHIIHPHHLKSGPARKERGVGMKATDKWAVPLCGFVHHREIERLGSRKEYEWFQDRGLDPYELAKALWLATGDIGRMVQVLVAHKQGAHRSLNRRAAINRLMAHGLTEAEAEEQYEVAQELNRRGVLL